VYLWCLASFSTLATLTGLTAIRVDRATMRYLSDVSVLLALLGAFSLIASGSHYASRRAVEGPLLLR
jgi:hypothetical protein